MNKLSLVAVDIILVCKARMSFLPIIYVSDSAPLLASKPQCMLKGM